MERELKEKILRKEISKEEFLNYLKTLESYQDYLFCYKMIENYNDFFEDFKKIKLGILRSFTLETFLPFLKVSLLKRYIVPEIFLGGYNSIAQDLIEPKDWARDLDFLIIWFRLEDLFPDLIYKFSYINFEEKKEIKDKIKEIISQWIDLAFKIQRGTVFVSNLDFPDFFPSEFYDSEDINGFIYFMEDLNYEILKIAREKGAFVLDLFKIQLKCGIQSYYDDRIKYISRSPYSSNTTLFISNYVARVLKSFLFPAKKVLVLDLDNTLWGGIIGEDGINGIKLGPDYPGNAYVDFQKRILNLSHNGVLLAISSKNNYEDAIEVIKNHPYMVLREDNFVIMKINWDEKENHLREISKILNLGTDSFVFLDDSDYECERIRKTMPEVKVYNVPKNPYEIPKFFDSIEDFDFVSISEEDKKRGKMYREEAKREELRLASTSLEDFYYSLKMRLQIGKATKDKFQRIAQLTQRTNQFNLTTKRYTEDDIIRFSQDENCRIYWARLLDNFGDYGIISTAIIFKEGEEWIMDTFLLSCRAIQRTVETAFLVYIIKKAKEEKIKKIRGEIIYTKKNIPARDFYQRHNFTKIEEREDKEVWEVLVDNFNLEYPKWFQLEEVFDDSR